jgi:hypothetical protein
MPAPMLETGTEGGKGAGDVPTGRAGNAAADLGAGRWGNRMAIGREKEAIECP